MTRPLDPSTLPRAVVTGGAGFVGSGVCDRLLADGWRVLAVDNLCTGRRTNVAHLVGDPRFELRVSDVCDPLDVDGPVAAVLQLASPASPFDYLALPIETLRSGAQGTFNALELAKAKGATFLLASTSEIYGDPLQHPQREDYLGNVSCTGPRSVYDEAKRYAEAATMACHRTWGVDTRIIRIFNTYGPRMKPRDGRVVTAFVVQALLGEPLTVFGDGRQTRSFCYVDDLVDGIVRVLARGDHLPYNLGNPSEFTIAELVAEVERLLGPQRVTYLPLPQDDPTRRCPDIGRARTHLGWEPRVALPEGLVRTIEGLRQTLTANP
ncbi:MAG: NAD-dependent epimerase/dehydratase family protein [Deltaproteobacteria bacterium]|nr:NAD-dependent epimerase/dehydratase family protein [Deltaproteobacteria bacterium]